MTRQKDPNSVCRPDPDSVRAPAMAFYRTYLRSDDKNPKTIAVYMEAVARLDRWLRHHPGFRSYAEADFDELPAGVLNQFLTDFRRGPEGIDGDNLDIEPEDAPRPIYTEHSASYTNQIYRSLQQFYRWRETERAPYAKQAWLNPMHAVRRRPAGESRLGDKMLSEPQVKAILGTVKRRRDFTSVRDHAILRLFLAGLRRSENALLEVVNLDLDGSRPAVTVRGKGDAGGERRRTVRIDPETVLAVQRYLMMRERHRLAWRPELWLGKYGPMTPDGVYHVVYDRAREVGLKVYPHMFRHTAARDWLAQGGNQATMMAHFGWESAAMPGRYTEEELERLAQDEAARINLGGRY